MERRTFLRATLGGSTVAGLAGRGAAARTSTRSSSAIDDTPTSGTAAGPLNEIEIITDEYGESHIYADDVYHLGYGNGYVQARDRLFLMDVIRHIGYGDSASVLGPAQIPSDIQVKRDLYSEAEIEQQWENAPEPVRQATQGYTDGVNRRMVEMAGQGNLPGEFAALGHAPEPWEPVDTVAAINYLIGFFGVSGGGELGNAQTLARLADSLGSWEAAYDAYADLNWLRTPESHYTSIPPGDKVVEGGEMVPSGPGEVPAEQLAFANAASGAEMWGIETDIAVPGEDGSEQTLTIPEAVVEGRREGQGVMEGFEWGSNALVVSGELSETDEPLLGGGPQMGFFKPPVPYEIGLHGDGFDISGIGVVGAPAIVIGRTAGGDDGETDRDALAWTVTSGRDDMVDTIAVELHPDDRHRYRWNGEWHSMDTHTVRHVASPAAPTLAGEPATRVVEQEVARIQENDATMPVIAWNPDANVAWCQRVTTRYEEMSGAFLWAELGRADDLDAFEAGLAEFPFTFNFHVVCESGDIGYYHTGRVPERAYDADYRLPAPGSTHTWNGTFFAQQGRDPSDPDDGTTVRNPSRGYVVNWNNGPAVGWRTGDAEQNWGSIHRVQDLDHFVREHLGVASGVPDGATVRRAATETLSVDDVRVLVSQAALHDATAQVIVPYLVDVAQASDDAQLRAMAEELGGWVNDFCPWHDEPSAGRSEEYYPPTHGNDTYVHAGHAIYDEVRTRLQELTFGDELGETLDSIDFEPPVSRHAAPHGTAGDDVTFYDALRGETNYDWFDDASTTETERRDDIIEQALKAAAAELEGRFETSDPGDWLQSVHKSRFLSIGATEMEAIDMRNRASYNQAISIQSAIATDGDTWQAAAGDVMPPGNSGHINGVELLRAQATGDEPDRLTDQLDLYVHNEYKPHPVTREQVEQVAVERQQLQATGTAPDGAIEPSVDLPSDVVDIADSTGLPDESTTETTTPDESETPSMDENGAPTGAVADKTGETSDGVESIVKNPDGST